VYPCVCSLLYSYTSSLFFLLLAIVGVLQYIYLLQDSLLYQPGHPAFSRNLHPLPKSTHEVVNFGRLNGLLFKHESGNVGTMIFFHGNAGNASNRTQMIEFMRSILKMNIFIFDYSGYGLSRGRPSESQLYQDGQAAIDYIAGRTDLRGDCMLYGRSLGGAVVIDLAARPENERIKAVLVENTFTSIPNMGCQLFPFLSPVIRLLPDFAVKNKFYSIQKVQMINQPILFISGRDDEIVPCGMMDELFSACSSTRKEMVRLRGHHNSTWTTAGYFDKMTNFLAKVNNDPMGDT